MNKKITWQIRMILATILGAIPLTQALAAPPTVTDVPKEPHARTSRSTKTETKSTSTEKKAPPTAAPEPVPPPELPTPVQQDAPGQLLDLANWKLTLPVDTALPGSPDEVAQPDLSAFSLEPYFWRSAGGTVFRAHAGGATTANSGYPRSELREMTGGQRASWSNVAGVHSMTIRQAITRLPAAKPHVVAGQIHDASDDVIMIRLEGTRLFVESGGDEIGLLDQNYALGTVFTVHIQAANGRIQVSYNDVLKVDHIRSGAGYYFKAGCYTQSNTTKGDAPDAYGEVIIYDLQVSHT